MNIPLMNLKKYLSNLPILFKLVPREKLWIYLAAIEGAVSSVLLCQEGLMQKPMYFTSHLFKDVELWYSTLEKLTMALTLTSCKLYPCFLSHPMNVLTNNAMGHVPTHLEASRRLVKWTTEFSEFDIQYQPLTIIKTQALADFTAETSGMRKKSSRIFFWMRFSTSHGSGVGGPINIALRGGDLADRPTQF